MLYKPTSKFLPKAAAFALVLSLFTTFHPEAHAQAFYVNIGPASFSANWGARKAISQYERRVIRQRTLRIYRPRVYATYTPAGYAPPAAYTQTAYRSTTQTPASYTPAGEQTAVGQGGSGEEGSYVGVDDPQTANSPEGEKHSEVGTPGPQGTSNAGPTVPGSRAVLRHGVAYAPANAPLSVKKAIWAINTIRTKPYIWGGGHDSFFAAGYDCSGTVSFALHYAGQLSSPTDSHSLMSFGQPGRGRWMTIYARNGHTWMEIAGLRLDTTGYYGNEGPRWRNDYRSPWGFAARHPVGL